MNYEKIERSGFILSHRIQMCYYESILKNIMNPVLGEILEKCCQGRNWEGRHPGITIDSLSEKNMNNLEGRKHGVL